MSKKDKLVSKLLAPINTSLASIIALYKILLGIWIISPVGSLVHQNLGLNGWGEAIVGSLCLAIGVVMMVGTITSLYRYLILGTFTAFYFWMGSCIILIFTDFQGIEWITALMITLYCGFIAVNLRVNKNYYDKLYLTNLHTK